MGLLTNGIHCTLNQWPCVSLSNEVHGGTTLLSARFGNEGPAQFIEKDVYRGQVYALNEIRDAINKLQAGALSGPALEQENQRKQGRLVEVRASLGEMTERALKLFAKLRRER